MSLKYGIYNCKLLTKRSINYHLSRSNFLFFQNVIKVLVFFQNVSCLSLIKLKWAFLTTWSLASIICFKMSVSLSICKYSHFYFFLDNFNQTLHRSFMGDGKNKTKDLCPFYKGKNKESVKRCKSSGYVHADT